MCVVGQWGAGWRGGGGTGRWLTHLLSLKITLKSAFRHPLQVEMELLLQARFQECIPEFLGAPEVVVLVLGQSVEMQL